MIRCPCLPCVEATKEEGRDDESLQEPNRWEIHCGMGQAKKWKVSVRVISRGAPHDVGKWLQGFLHARVVPARAQAGATVGSQARQTQQDEEERSAGGRGEHISPTGADAEHEERRRDARPPPSVGQACVPRVDPVRGSWRETSQPGRKQSRRVRHPGAGGDGGAKLDARGQPDLSPAVAEGADATGGSRCSRLRSGRRTRPRGSRRRPRARWPSPLWPRRRRSSTRARASASASPSRNDCSS